MTLRNKAFSAGTTSVNTFLPTQVYEEQNEKWVGMMPQYVSIRSTPKNSIFLDSKDRVLTSQTIGCFTIDPSLSDQAIKRIQLNFLQIQWNIPNVNLGNNEITFFSTASGINHTVTVPVGFYDHADLATFATAIETALNTVTGASGLTWTVAPEALQRRLINFSTVGGTFHFVDTGSRGSMSRFGRSLINLPTTLTNTAAKAAGPVNMCWTRSIFILSNTLTRTSSIRSVGSGIDNTNVLDSLLIPRELQSKPGTIQVDLSEGPIITFIMNNVSNIDIELQDEYNRPYGQGFIENPTGDSTDDLILGVIGEL